ncbi:hypothetical protein [Clostridium rectalis]|uniref:hypothetical protein n=1 Tax=Clostridium rectalis TaxID=2040295 RepID=UPI000F639BC5|nr:hypothetical protein [Clostridium rectalis]
MVECFKVDEYKSFERDLEKHLDQVKSKGKILELKKSARIIEDSVKKLMPSEIKNANFKLDFLNENSIEISIDVEDARKINNGYVIHDVLNNRDVFIPGNHFIEKGIKNSKFLILKELSSYMNGLLDKLK